MTRIHKFYRETLYRVWYPNHHNNYLYQLPSSPRQVKGEKAESFSLLFISFSFFILYVLNITTQSISPDSGSNCAFTFLGSNGKLSNLANVRY